MIAELRLLGGVRSVVLVDREWRCVLDLVDPGDAPFDGAAGGSADSLADLRTLFGAPADIVVSLSSTFHLARTLPRRHDLVVHLVLARNHGLLAQARLALARIATALDQRSTRDVRW